MTQTVVKQPSQLLPLPPGDIRLSLQALPEAWTFVQEALTRSAMPVVLDERPEAMSWSEVATSSALILRYANQPATSTHLALASAAGWYDVTQRSLPDGTMVQEFLSPVKKIAGAQVSSTASNSGYMASGTMIQIGTLDPALLSLQQSCGSGADRAYAHWPAGTDSPIGIGRYRVCGRQHVPPPSADPIQRLS